MTKLLFIARPSYSYFEPESDYAAKYAVDIDDDIEAHSAAFRQSMQCKNLNEHWVCCLNAGKYDYFGQLHSDVAPNPGWASKCIKVMEDRGWDIIHAPCRFKNEVGITSTAVGFSDSYFYPARRITTTELADLPESFDLADLQRIYDKDATRFLFNTGCMVVKLGPWAWDFPGFTMIDRLVPHEGKLHAVSVSEDYLFAHWAHEHGLKAGAVKIRTGHWGRKEYASDEIVGSPVDEQYYRELAGIQKAAG